MSKMDGFQPILSYRANLQCFGNPRISVLMMRSRLQNSKSLYSKDLFAHYGCVNAIEFTSDGEWLASGGDDRRILLWNVVKATSSNTHPICMKAEHNSNIFCLCFGSANKRLFSAGNDEQVILHDLKTGEALDIFLHDEAVYGLSVDPFNNNIFASACDDGRILVWDIRESHQNDPLMLAGSSSAFHAVMYNPAESHLIATANSREGVDLWDIRKPRCYLLKYGLCFSSQSSMSVRFNTLGTSLIALRRRLPPVLYHINSTHPVVEFDHPGYYNSCTMKSCCFAGDQDQFILSGSDDFKLYMWKIPDEAKEKKGLWMNRAHIFMKGHRSIVNQVRYNNTNCVIASSGVEKIVKLWSTFPMEVIKNIDDESGNKQKRKVYTHEEYINLVLESGHFMTHDYSSQSIKEDSQMMAFFDSLVQRDIEGWSSDSSNSSGNTDLLSGSFDILKSNGGTRVLPCPTVFSSTSTDSDSSDQDESDILTPQVVSYIFSLKDRVESTVQQSFPFEIEAAKPVEDTSDHISQLISRKRQEQLLRTAKAAINLVKKYPEHFKKNKNSLPQMSSDPEDNQWCLDNARKVIERLLSGHKQNQTTRDKTRFLRHKRARILKNPICNNSSSDSEPETKQPNLNNNCAVSDSVPLERTSMIETAVIASHSSNDSSLVTNICNSPPPCISEQRHENSDDNEKIEKTISFSLETENAKTVTFTRPKLRKNNRNYRKRNSSEDCHDE